MEQKERVISELQAAQERHDTENTTSDRATVVESHLQQPQGSPQNTKDSHSLEYVLLHNQKKRNAL